MSYHVVPLKSAEVAELVNSMHRHNKNSGASYFAFGINKVAPIGGTPRPTDMQHTIELIGGCVVGPVTARLLGDAPRTCELKRLVTDGSKNACSFGYGAAWRIARELGYLRMVTYTLQTESGSSLRASGWRVDDPNVPARQWKSRAPEHMHLRWKDRPDACASPSFPRIRWIIGAPWPETMARYREGAENPSSPNYHAPTGDTATRPASNRERPFDSAQAHQ